ncbi:MAG TPA: histidine kinase [Streptomyces sp.]|nr:histidine kinase [Streptomyces sp.]
MRRSFPSSPPRSARQRTLDLVVVLLAALLSFASLAVTGEGMTPFPQTVFWPLNAVLEILGLPWLAQGEWLGGVVACGALWWRRSRPTAVAVGLLLAGLLYPVVVPATIAVFTVAAHRPLRTTAWVAGLAVLPFPLDIALRSHHTVEDMVPGLFGIALVAAAVGWGLFVRSLHERVARAEADAVARTEQAQRAARDEIAREMHDVLAHRLSLLSLHAGALKFTPGAPEAEIAHAAGVIRESAHGALQELRTVIGVLRAHTAEESAVLAPQPSIGDLAKLVQESREAGAQVRFRFGVAEPEGVPALTGRTAYRIVQEGLTNARKHAEGATVRIELTGGPPDGLTVELRNRTTRAPATIPGGGQGLVGLTERAVLAGGRLSHGRSGNDYCLRAWLPWAA